MTPIKYLDENLQVVLWTTLTLVAGEFTGGRKLLAAGGVALFSAVCVHVVVFLVGRSIRCPLCMALIFGYQKCQLHRRASRILGSIRLKAAVDVLFRRSFVCPYCNENASTVRTRSGR